MWGKKYVYAGMTQLDLCKSQNEIQEHNKPTEAVSSFITNFNFKQVSIQKTRGSHFLTEKENYNWAGVVWYCSERNRSHRFYAMWVPLTERWLGTSWRIEAVSSFWTVTELLAFWNLHFCLWKCSWLRWSLFYIYIKYLDNNWSF